jgi:hypothetical protein
VPYLEKKHEPYFFTYPRTGIYRLPQVVLCPNLSLINSLLEPTSNFKTPFVLQNYSLALERKAISQTVKIQALKTCQNTGIRITYRQMLQIRALGCLFKGTSPNSTTAVHDGAHASTYQQNQTSDNLSSTSKSRDSPEITTLTTLRQAPRKNDDFRLAKRLSQYRSTLQSTNSSSPSNTSNTQEKRNKPLDPRKNSLKSKKRILPATIPRRKHRFLRSVGCIRT